MKMRLRKVAGVFVPDLTEDSEAAKPIKDGSIIEVDYKQPRNAAYHRKFFAMLSVGFDAFNPEDAEYNGIPAQKSRERFRKDVICQAGFYDLTFNLRGEPRAEAKSISFSNMSESDFNQLYNACRNVLLQKVLSNYSRDDLDQVVEKLIRV